MDISGYITPVPNMSYFVVLVDYGPKAIGSLGPYGYEAVVRPEHTKRETIEYVREKIGDELCIVHVKRIEGNHCEDVTEEIVGAAVEAMQLEAAE